MTEIGSESAASAGLRYVNDQDPGIRRVGKPGRFDYRDAEDRRVRDPEALERIRRLVIPPAWTDVWICPDPRGRGWRRVLGSPGLRPAMTDMGDHPKERPPPPPR